LILFTRTAGPSETLTVAQLREHARIDHTTEDAAIAAYIEAAADLILRLTGRAIGAQTWTASLQAWPGSQVGAFRRVRLSPYPDAVTSVTVDGTALAAETYRLRGDELLVSPDVAEPGSAITSEIVVTYTAGANLPPALLQALKFLATNYYENRESGVLGTVNVNIPFSISVLLQPFIVMREI
jgi:uncharacterized phiE125 gp8 family phage protein